MPEHNGGGSPSPEEAINGRALRSLPHHPLCAGGDEFSGLLGVPTQSHRIEAVGSLLEESLVFAEGAEGGADWVSSVPPRGSCSSTGLDVHPRHALGVVAGPDCIR